MISIDRLTDEQQAIAAHEEGPALVFAVAGAGKTTSMVHRVNYLVHGRGVDPGRILASSFSRATVDDLTEALAAVGVDGVNARTLHSLGFQLVREAEQQGHLPPRTQQQDENPSVLASILARRSLTRLAMERDLDTYELGIDQDELLDQVATWKQELAYADLDAADLPASARPHVTSAEHDEEDFLTLYRYFEELRRQEGWLTFDDMLVEGWEVLHRFPDLRARAQAAHDYVIVDEFQDVSRVQYRMLDILTEPQGDGSRNYMAIGDDDQCIYEWRGADPSFILDFADRYDADEYLITDNFRSPAPQVALANAVIRHNDERREKHVHLTRGFDGHAEVTGLDGPQAEARYVADRLDTLTARGRSLDDTVVLVRTYAQTPFLESTLIDREVPYRIVGNVPFYRRREVRTLLRYGYWAVLERRIDETGWFDSRRDARHYVDRFQRILKRPNRYVKHDLIERICTDAVQRQTSVLDVLVGHLPSMHDRTADRVDRFLGVAERLVDRLDDPADEVLDWLIDALDYDDYLRERSAIAEVGEARVRTARSLVAFADGHDSVPALLQEIVRISTERAADNDDAPCLEIRSIHRAKGLEWPFVFVPGCNEGTLPQRKTRVERSSPTSAASFEDFQATSTETTEVEVDVEEERRLLYVAITRSREGLVLTYDRGEAVSSFLEEADAEAVLDTVQDVKTGLHEAPGELSDADAARLCRGVVELGLERYLRTRYAPSDRRRDALRQRMDAFGDAIEAAQATVEAHAEAVRARATEQAEVQARKSDAAETVDALTRELGERGLPLSHEQPDTYYPDDATFTFRETDDGDVAAIWNGERVATLDPLAAGGPPPDITLSVPWEAVVATFDRVARGRRTLYVEVDTEATYRRLDTRVGDAPESGPAPSTADALDAAHDDSPDAETQLLAASNVAEGHDLLLDVLATPPSSSPSASGADE